MQSQPGGAPPVFVDRTGRRRRLTILAGTAMGLGLLTSLALIAAGLFGGSSVPLPGWSEGNDQPPIEAGVDQPAELGRAGESPGAPPSPSPLTSTVAPVRPGATTSGTTPAAPTRTTGPATPAPTVSSSPGQGDERRSTAKPSRSPGKPG